jgi:transposase-like protein
MEKTQVNHENGIHPTMLSKWKREYNENPGAAFSGNGKILLYIQRIGKRNLFLMHYESNDHVQI